MTSTRLKTGVKHVGSHAPWREDREVPDPSHPGLLYRHGHEGKQGIRVVNSKDPSAFRGARGAGDEEAPASAPIAVPARHLSGAGVVPIVPVVVDRGAVVGVRNGF